MINPKFYGFTVSKPMTVRVLKDSPTFEENEVLEVRAQQFGGKIFKSLDDKIGKPDIRVAVMSAHTIKDKNYNKYHVFADMKEAGEHFEEVPDTKS